MFKLDRMQDDNKKLKYPKRFQPMRDIFNFDENLFYWVNIERKNNKTLVYLIITVSIVLGVCLFPIWPLSLKLGIWWILLFIMVFLVII
jgi:translocation protein SEC62